MLTNNELTRLAKFAESAEKSYERLRPRTQEVFFDWTIEEVKEALQDADIHYFMAVIEKFGKGKNGLIVNYKALTKAINEKQFPQPRLKEGWIYVRETKSSPKGND